MRTAGTARRRPHPPALALAVVVAGAALLRLYYGISDLGLYWPDEVFQSVEQSHRVVYGYGIVPWEFHVGARNWTLPGLIAGMLWAARLLGITGPDGYLVLVRAAFIAVSAATTLGVWMLARALGASRWSAIAGASAFAFAGPIVYFGHRALSETASALPVVFGLALALSPAARAGRRGPLAGGAALLGLAAVLRLQNAVFAAALVGVLAVRRDWRGAGVAAAVLAACALVLGVLDAVTWGSWFGSARTYLDFTLVEGRADEWGTASWRYYGRVLLSSMPEVAIPLAVLVLVAARRAPEALAVAAVYVVVHSAIPHKELRFILPAAPLLCALAAVGLDAVRDRFGTVAWRTGATGLVALALASGARAGGLTFGDLGTLEPTKTAVRAWSYPEDVNRMIRAAHDREDLCGLKVETKDWWWTGGLSLLHRDVPFYGQDGPRRDSGRFNYVVASAGTRGGATVDRRGDQVLVRLRTRCGLVQPVRSAGGRPRR